MPGELTITIGPKLAEDLRVLSEATKESPEAFVNRVLQIAIDAAIERGKRQLAKEAKAKPKRG